MNPNRREILRLRADLVAQFTKARSHLIRGRRAVMNRGEAARGEWGIACLDALDCFERVKTIRLRIKVLAIQSRAGSPSVASCRPCEGQGVGIDQGAAWICADCHGSGEPGMRGAA